MSSGPETSERELGKGQVVPNSARPQKSATLYPDARLNSPHSYSQPFVSVDGKGGMDLSGPYEPVVGWPDAVVDGWRADGAAALVAESADRILAICHYGLKRDWATPIVWGANTFSMEGSPYATRKTLEKRPDHFVTAYDRAGRVIETWTWNDHLFGKLNRVFIDPKDPDRHVWITDSIKQTVFKFSHDGRELALRIGEVEAGSNAENPWKAQDVAFLPNGDFYTGGLGRVDRFTADGRHTWSYQRRGTGPGEFQDLHGIVLDTERKRIYCSDRGNSRIQVFDEDWNFLDEWRNILAPYTLRLSKDGHIWIGDGFTQKFLKYDLDGHLLLSWGTFGIAPGAVWGIHWFDTDEEGNLYVAEDYGDRIQKFTPRADVATDDPRFLGPLVD